MIPGYWGYCSPECTGQQMDYNSIYNLANKEELWEVGLLFTSNHEEHWEVGLPFTSNHEEHWEVGLSFT